MTRAYELGGQWLLYLPILGWSVCMSCTTVATIDKVMDVDGAVAPGAECGTLDQRGCELDRHCIAIVAVDSTYRGCVPLDTTCAGVVTCASGDDGIENCQRV